MKKPVISALLCIWMSTAIISQNSAPVKVPMLATKALQSKFPGTKKPVWTKTSTNNYVAEFKLSGDKTFAVFDDHGTFIETQKPMPERKLPDPVKSTVGAEFKGFSTSDHALIETAANEKFYKVVVDKGHDLVELRLTAAGSITKTTTTAKQP